MQPSSPAERYRQWLADTAARLRAQDVPPATPEAARRLGETVRRRIREVDGLPSERCPLNPEVLGTLQRDGYRVEKLVFQTRPGVFATATAYVPATRGPVPAVLNVHGHWPGARRDPKVQARCIGLAKLGFFTLTLDAWGAGERGTRVGQNEYHGGLLGASLWPVGTPLHGLQLWDNIRALDYLQSRPEVDGARLGCTGASGGGNQTTYLSAYDERVKCAVPVCSVGTFASYLTAACCVDEVLLHALTFAEEGDLLGMVAPRSLMVVSATRDSYHFGPDAARAALDRARPYFRAHGADERVRHAVFESGHDYSQAMREAMYGWMRRWLKGEGDGSPVPEPAFETDDPELLRCYAPPFRPGRVMTTVRWVRERAEELSREADRADWRADANGKRAQLRELLRLPAAEVSGPKPAVGAGGRYQTEAGVEVPVRVQERDPKAVKHGILLLHPEGAETALQWPSRVRLDRPDLGFQAPELRGCGALRLPSQNLGEQIPDHNLVEWSFWIGRPLLGQWVHDIRQLTAHLGDYDRIALVGWREAGLAALIAAALDDRVDAAVAIEAPASFASEGVPHGVRMAAFLPDLLKVGDVPHLAALCAPRRVLIANPLALDGSAPMGSQLDTLYRTTRATYEGARASDRLVIRQGLSDQEVAETLARWL